MTKHNEPTGPSGNDDAAGGDKRLAAGAAEGRRAPEVQEAHEGSEATEATEVGEGREATCGHDEPLGYSRRADQLDCTPYGGLPAEHQVTLRTPAELADALPYLLGYRPEDSIVLVALHERDGRGRFGGRARLGIPANADDWESAAKQLAHGLTKGSERRGARPEQMVAFLCQEPPQGQTGRQVMERLRPLAQQMRVACGSLDVPVIEALCISDGRFWSYCCDKVECCPPEGRPMGLPGTSVLAAAATYAGLQVRGTLRELQARLLPWENAAALEQEVALDTIGMALVPRILDDSTRAGVAEESLGLAEQLLHRFAAAAPVSGTLTADLRDDELLSHDEAARLILGLQDRTIRDRVAEWMEGDEAGPALRLWRALARRCVGPYSEHAAPLLTLAGWVAWSTGDELEAREALAMALGADSDYLFARLLHQACNEGLDPESIRRCLRAERVGREKAASGDVAEREQRSDAERTFAGPTTAGRPDQAEDVGEAVQNEAAKAPAGPYHGGGLPGSRQCASATDSASHSSMAAERKRVTRASRPRRTAGTHAGAPRVGGGTARPASRSTAPRNPKKRADRRSVQGPEGAPPKAFGAEEDM